MPKSDGGSRLDQAQTRQILDGYMQYRFRQSLVADDLAKKAGVKPEVAQRLLAQQPVDDADLTRVAHALGMSGKLLRQVCGLEPISKEMLETIDGFLARTVAPKERARGAGEG